MMGLVTACGADAALSYPLPRSATAPSHQVVRPAIEPSYLRFSMSTPTLQTNQWQIVLCGDLASFAPGWQLVRPLILTLEQDSDGSFLVSEDEYLVYGIGATPNQALRDYIRSLVEYRELVAAGAERSAHDREELCHIDSHLRRI